MRALNRHAERVFNPDSKDHHWGKRKLARDRSSTSLRFQPLELSTYPDL